MKVEGLPKDISIQELLETINKKHGTHTALQIKRNGSWQRLSYIDLGNRTIDVSSTLIKFGIEKGDRCVILSESRPEWGIALFGIISCGCITVPLDIKLKEKEIENILRHAEPKAVFVSEKFIPIAKSMKSQLPFIQAIFSLEDASSDPEIKSIASLKYKKGDEKYRPIQESDTALIVYTSGTTGIPKGVELTFGNLLFEVLSFYKLVSYSKKDNFLSVLPLNHMLEITGGFIAPLYGGATVTYCESLRPNEIAQLMKETHTTVMVAVPLLLKMIHSGILRKIESSPKDVQRLFDICMAFARHSKKLKINLGRILFKRIHNEFGGRLKVFISGGAPLDPKVGEDFDTIGIPILQGYGLTETSPVVTVNIPQANKIGSVGRPIPGTEVKIIYNSESDTEGEILTKGLNIMKGYYKAPEKTAEVIKDGWFHTGDIGRLDEDGFLYISGRCKNLIVTGAGKKVHPEELEEELSKSPYIKEVCIVGKIIQEGSHKGTEEVYGVFVPNYDYFKMKKMDSSDEAVERIIKEELIKYTKNVAEYKRIIDFEIWKEEFPKTASRKIKRKEVLEIISRGDKKKAPVTLTELVETSADDETALKLKAIVSKLAGISPDKITPSSNLYNDIGIDSLMKVELLCAVDSEFKFHIPDTFAYNLNTFEDLVRIVKEYGQGRTDMVKVEEEFDIKSIIEKNPLIRFVRLISYIVLYLFMKLYFRLTIHGQENLPKTRAFIIAPNHSSILDLPSILTGLPFAITHNVLVPAAKDYFYGKGKKRALVELAFNTFPFERFGNFVMGMKICEEILKKGHPIVLFPEGTRSKEGKLQDFKPGIGALSYDLKIPIVPTYIKGAGKALPKGRFFPKPNRIEVYFGKPVYASQYTRLEKEMPRYEIYKRLAKDTKEDVYELKLAYELTASAKGDDLYA